MDKLHDLSGRNLSDYLMKTRLDYKLKRVYGFQFGRKPQFWEKNGQVFKKIRQNNATRATDKKNETLTSWSDHLRDIKSYDSEWLNRENNIYVWWNNKGLHVLPSAINSLNNLLLRHNLKKVPGERMLN